MDNFIVQLIARLDASQTLTDVNKIEQQLNKKGINLKTVLNTASTKQELQNFARTLSEITGIDMSKITSEFKQIQKEAQNTANQIKNIQYSLDTEKYSKDIAKINNELSKVGKFTLSDQSNADVFDKAKTSAQSLKTTYDQLKSTMADTNATDQQKIQIEEKYQQQLLTTKNLLSQISLSKDDEIVSVGSNERVNMIATLNNYLAKNTAMGKANENQIKSWISTFSSSADMTKGDIKQINSDFKTLDASLRASGKLGLSMWDKFKQAVEKFGGWSLVTGAMTKLWQGIKKVYNASLDLDKAITNLNMATDLNEKQINALVDSYSKLGEKLNATLTDVIESGTEWLKQGQSIEDTETLITNAMILSKIAGLSSADATKYLTSAMKGYQVAAEDTLDVVDKLSAVDMASATDVGGLAEGMSEVASSAELAGVSMDKLLGYLATIGEVTQSGMSEVGTTLNAVFSRMGNIKLSRLTDYESGEDLSNVETVLRGVGISLRDTNDSFRDFDEVLDETADRWESFSETQQRAIASAFAGTRNQNEFIILMENYGKAMEYAEVSTDSSGEALEKFDDYQQSVTAHTDLFNKAIQDLANTAIDSGLVNWFIDLGTGAIKFLDGITKLLTPLGTLAAGIGAFAGIKNIGRPKMFGLVLKYADNYKCSLGY